MIIVRVKFDSESQSWWATADIDERHALATGADTFEELLNCIPVVLRSLLIDANGAPDARLFNTESSLLLTVVTLGLVLWAVCMLCAVAS